MVKGKFQDYDVPVPLVPALVAWGDTVRTPLLILDTGFTGDIAVTQGLVDELGLTFDMAAKMQTANGTIEDMRMAMAFATMEETTLYVTAVLVKGKPLVGISFLQKFNYMAIVDCKNKTVALEVAP